MKLYKNAWSTAWVIAKGPRHASRLFRERMKLTDEVAIERNKPWREEILAVTVEGVTKSPAEWCLEGYGVLCVGEPYVPRAWRVGSDAAKRQEEREVRLAAEGFEPPPAEQCASAETARELEHLGRVQARSDWTKVVHKLGPPIAQPFPTPESDW